MNDMADIHPYTGQFQHSIAARNLHHTSALSHNPPHHSQPHALIGGLLRSNLQIGIAGNPRLKGQANRGRVVTGDESRMPAQRTQKPASVIDNRQPYPVLLWYQPAYANVGRFVSRPRAGPLGRPAVSERPVVVRRAPAHHERAKAVKTWPRITSTTPFRHARAGNTGCAPGS